MVALIMRTVASFDLDESSYQLVAGVTGLEPAASGVTGQRSNQLSYTPSFVAQ